MCRGFFGLVERRPRGRAVGSTVNCWGFGLQICSARNGCLAWDDTRCSREILKHLSFHLISGYDIYIYVCVLYITWYDIITSYDSVKSIVITNQIISNLWQDRLYGACKSVWGSCVRAVAIDISWCALQMWRAGRLGRWVSQGMW